MDFTWKKCPCWLQGLIKVVAIITLTFVVMTVYLQTFVKKERFLDLEQIAKDVDKNIPEEEKKELAKEQEQLDYEDAVAQNAPVIPDEKNMLKLQRAPRANRPFSLEQLLKPVTVTPVAPVNVRAKLQTYMPDVKLEPITLSSLGVDTTNPYIKRLTNIFENRPPLAELIKQVNENRPQYGLAQVDKPLPPLDDVASKFNSAFITQTEFVDVVQSSNYFKTMSKADLIARGAYDTSTKQPSADVYFATYVSSYVPFTEEQKYKVLQAVVEANKMLRPYQTLFHIKWKFSKIKNKIENSFPHTLRDVIIITDDFLKKSVDEIVSTIIHEKFHIFQRQFPNDITRLVSLLEFVPLSSSQVLMIDYVLRALMRNNPDLDGAIYMYKPANKVIAQLYDTTEPESISNSRAVMLSLNSHGTNSEIVKVTNESLNLPKKLRCQLEHPYEITACIITELITNPAFYNANKKNKHLQVVRKWMNEFLR